MGMLIDGEWDTDAVAPQSSGGSFIRLVSPYRETISEPGAGRFPAEKGRYNIIVSYACPWAHRTLIYRALLGLEDVIDISVVHPISYPNGWTFKKYNGVINNTGLDVECLHELYASIDPKFTGKVLVPILWDKKTKTIVNNESSEIIRLLDGPFSKLIGRKANTMLRDYPANDIEAMNDFVYKGLNNGVYRVGFSQSQEAYDTSVKLLFNTLDKLEEVFFKSEFLLGDQPCECDWRLLPTLVRFDPVYYYHFKCNQRKLSSYGSISRYIKRLLSVPNVAETIHMDHIIDHYYLSHVKINPHGIIPFGVSNALFNL